LQRRNWFAGLVRCKGSDQTTKRQDLLSASSSPL
jgi:hypothetical protein